ncbi:MAG TPA: alanine racemase [Bryobacteraceae bacterium]|nr:alanine racemase [Bryobacteraceae bacterium]
MPPVPYRSYALISREQIAQNYRNVCAAVGPNVAVMGVVKADAYGHGALEVARVLTAEGATWLAVSSVEEGVTLRKAGIAEHILVMTGFLPFEWDALVTFDLTPALHSLAAIADLDRMARESSKPIGYHLKIDSGMHRLGTRAAAGEIIQALASATHARLDGLMTHFASPADYTSQQTEEQAAYFAGIVERLANAGFRPSNIHMSSTNALAYKRNPAWLTMVRPGHAIYGYVSPARGDAPKPAFQVKPVLTWRAKILVVKEITMGALVGYGGSFRAPEPMRIGVIAAGYADGVPHRLSNRGKVIAAGKLVPILGTVSMDLTTIDLTHADSLRPGDEVTLLGREGQASLDAQQMARMAGTISYAILCGIGARVERIYV